MEPPAAGRERGRAAYAAAAWMALFGLMSCAWAAGAPTGAETLGVEIERLARERDAGFVATLWITGALKLIAAALPLALVRGRPGGGDAAPASRARRALALAVGAIGAAMALYAVANGVQHGLMASGAIDTPDGLGERAVTWHLALWDPFWLLGGVLYLAAARQDRRRRARIR